MATDEDDDAPLTHEELVAKWRWKPGERELAERELAEREQRIAAAEMLTPWRRGSPAAEPPLVTKSAPAPAPGLSRAAAQELLRSMRPVTPEKLAELPVALQEQIERALFPASERNLMDAVGTVIGKQARETDATIKHLQERIDALEAQVARLEAAGKGLRAVG